MSSDTIESDPQGLGIEDAGLSQRAGNVGRSAQGKRQIRMSSGSFLLDSPPWGSDLCANGRSGKREQRSSKGKRVSSLSTRSSLLSNGLHSPQSHSLSIGKSPLSSEVRNSPELNGRRNQRPEQEVSANSSRAPSKLHDGETPRPVSGSLGKDEAQIVELALKLSESRRRQMQTGAASQIPLASPEALYPAGQLAGSLAQNSLRTSSLSPYSTQRKGSRNISPRLGDGITPRGSYVAPTLQVPQDPTGLASPVVPIWHIQSVNPTNLAPSDATKSRVARAKQSFELMDLYHQLLDALPPFPSTRSSKPGTTRSNRSDKDGARSHGRAYNPLQYIRNRKTRALKGYTIDAEVDGWKDVDKVRSWVSKVTGEQLETSSPEKPRLLPKFEELSVSRSSDDASSGSRIPRPRSHLTRQRLVWKFQPWDLLADAYWIDQDDDRGLIEDRRGRRIYSPKPASVHEESPAPKSSASEPSRRSMSRGRNSSNAPIRIDFAADEGDIQKPRGRRQLRLQESVFPAYEPADSIDKTRKWAHKLIRSQSSSSTAKSRSGSLSPQHRQRPRLNSQERRDTAILEKQVNEILASGYVLGETPQSPGDSEARLGRTETPETQSPITTLPKSNLIVEESRDTVIDEQTPSKKSTPSRKGHALHRSKSSHDTDISTTPNSPDSRFNMHSIATNILQPKSRKLTKLVTGNALPRLSISDDRSSARPDNGTDVKQSPGGGRRRIDDYQLEGGFLSPKSAESLARTFRYRSNSRSGRNDEATKDRDEKRRSRRIPGFVSNPVQKMSDFIRRKDASDPSDMRSMASDASDSEVDESNTLDHHPGQQEKGDPSMSSIERDGSTTRRKYHRDNLPIFKSPRRDKDQDGVDSGDRTPEGIQRVPLQEYDRFNRFRRFGSVDLGTRSVSLTPSLPQPDSGSRKESGSNAYEPQALQASRRLAIVQGSPTANGQFNPITGIDKLSPVDPATSNGAKSLALQVWSKLGPLQRPITTTDVTRLQALATVTSLLSTSISDPILTSGTSYQGQASRVAPQELVQAHFDAANAELSSLKETHRAFQETTGRFSKEAVDGLHEQIRGLDTRISSTVTSRVRESADDADALGGELATNRTLQVKRLNDRIDLIVRRRRRRFRWLRRSGYLLLEWTLLATMWWVWLVVVIFRLARGLVRGAYHSVRWLLWL